MTNFDHCFPILYSSQFFFLYSLPSGSTLFLFSLEKHRLLKETTKYNKTKYKIKQDHYIKIGQGNPTQGKETHAQSQEQRPTCTRTQESNKNTKVKAIIYMQGTWCGPVQAPCLLFSGPVSS